MENDATYYRRRACEEQLAAAGATHPKVRARHLELAAAYDYRVRLILADQCFEAPHAVATA